MCNKCNQIWNVLFVAFHKVRFVCNLSADRFRQFMLQRSEAAVKAVPPVNSELDWTSLRLRWISNELVECPGKRWQTNPQEAETTRKKSVFKLSRIWTHIGDKLNNSWLVHDSSEKHKIFQQLLHKFTARTYFKPWKNNSEEIFTTPKRVVTKPTPPWANIKTIPYFCMIVCSLSQSTFHWNTFKNITRCQRNLFFHVSVCYC